MIIICHACEVGWRMVREGFLEEVVLEQGPPVADWKSLR